jgi:hypothetical protein
MNPRSVLFVTLDSCRYDTFALAAAPAMKAVGPLHRAQAPSHFTFGSHAAMFAGFTPGVAGLQAPFLNPKFGKVFKLAGAAFPGKGTEAYQLQGRNIIDGFNRLGYLTVGTGAAGWFDTDTETGRVLAADFARFWFAGDTYSLRRQLAWLEAQLEGAADQPVFAFLNVGETHVPYYFEGAPWSPQDNPCRPFQTVDRADDCRLRQRLACEWVDAELAPLLARFEGATVILCADHGDCWGEDGLWEHGISHEMTLTVPLLMRVAGRPVAESADQRIGAAPRPDAVPGAPAAPDDVAALMRLLQDQARTLDRMTRSPSWRLTAPLRRLASAIAKARRP